MKGKVSKSVKSWERRLSGQIDEETMLLLASLDVDAELYKYDIIGSLAHAIMLREIGILTGSELSAIRKGLKKILTDIESGKIKLDLA
ncbi:MAG: argininosuccinate lyase, partial [Planctomycetes bacterium]|nr:argininosuccinate lyase [Planctomycetota bacterium]